MGTYSTRQLRELNELKEKWESYEHDKWALLSFSETEARYGWVTGQMYTKYVTITAAQIKFFVGVPPDVLDKYYA